ERVGDEAVLSVRDRGIGIAPAQQEHIFELFTQLGGSPAHPHTGGLGVGLAIVRRLVTMHGGSVAVRSSGVGHGTEFIVRLPALAADAPLEPAAPPPRQAAAPRRVLVADDNEDAAEMLAS